MRRGGFECRNGLARKSNWLRGNWLLWKRFWGNHAKFPRGRQMAIRKIDRVGDNRPSVPRSPKPAAFSERIHPAQSMPSSWTTRVRDIPTLGPSHAHGAGGPVGAGGNGLDDAAAEVRLPLQPRQLRLLHFQRRPKGVQEGGRGRLEEGDWGEGQHSPALHLASACVPKLPMTTPL